MCKSPVAVTAPHGFGLASVREFSVILLHNPTSASSFGASGSDIAFGFVIASFGGIHVLGAEATRLWRRFQMAVSIS